MIAGILVLFVVFGSLYALYRSILKREDGYYDGWDGGIGEYGDFDGPDDDDYLTDEEWEKEQAELDKLNAG